MIALEAVEKIIRRALRTGNLKDVRPLSVIVIAKKESAKTEEVAQFAENDGVLYLNSFTPTSFMEEYILDFDNGKYHHLIIPDLLNCISRQKYLVDTTITFLNSFCEEGVKEILSKAFEGLKIPLTRPVRGGVITTIAKEDFEARWKKWSSVGFLTRFLPVSFQYGRDVVDKILLACAEEDEVNVLGKSIKPPLPPILNNNHSAKVKVDLSKELSHQLIEPGKAMQKRLSTYGFRGVRHLRRLTLATALDNNRDIVTQDDIDEVLELVKFCNLDYPTIGDEPPPKFAEDYEVEGGKND